MVKVLAVSDETVETLWCEHVRSLDVDLLLGAGDLPFDYLEYLTDVLDVPCVFVPGNHDIDLSGYSSTRLGWTRAGWPAKWPGPAGGINADRRVVSAAGLRIAGLGGSIRYRPGPNQWTEPQQRRRARAVTRAATDRFGRERSKVDIVLTHSPPRDVGDAPDPPHRGFACLRDLVEQLRPQALVHGHIHPHGFPQPDFTLGGVRVINTVGYTLINIQPGGTGPIIARRRYA